MANHPHHQQKHTFVGRMNLDDSPISPSTDWSKDYPYALNVRVALTTGGNDGTVENVRGTVELDNADLLTFLSGRISETRTCGAHSTGQPAIYTISAGLYSSAVSQEDAQAQAQAFFDSTKEAYFAANLVCTPDTVISYNVGAVQVNSGDACADASLGVMYAYDDPLKVGSDVYADLFVTLAKPDGYYKRTGYTYVYHIVSGVITEIIGC